VAVACQGDGGTNGRTDGDLCLLHDPNPNPNPNRSKVIHELLIPQLAGLANADRKLAKRQRGFVKNTHNIQTSPEISFFGQTFIFGLFSYESLIVILVCILKIFKIVQT